MSVSSLKLEDHFSSPDLKLSENELDFSIVQKGTTNNIEIVPPPKSSQTPLITTVRLVFFEEDVAVKYLSCGFELFDFDGKRNLKSFMMMCVCDCVRVHICVHTCVFLQSSLLYRGKGNWQFSHLGVLMPNIKSC